MVYSGIDFDLIYAGTYYTRPMSVDWSKLRDIDLLADSKAEFDLCVPLAPMPRVPREYVGPENEIRARLRFARESTRVTASVALHGTLVLTCQRCLRALEWPLETCANAVLVGAEAEADALPPGTETVLAADRKVRLIDLIEEELLLALPLVPMHADEARPKASVDASPPVQRPFEQLGELLKRRN